MGIPIQTPYIPQEQRESALQKFSEDILIKVYVPDADQMTREEALKLALDRDLQAATVLMGDFA